MDYEQVIYIPMSSGLSGSYDTAAVMAREYQGRVYPVNNRRISVTLQQSVLEARFYADQGMTAEEIVRLQRTDHTRRGRNRDDAEHEAGIADSGWQAGRLSQGTRYEGRHE